MPPRDGVVSQLAELPDDEFVSTIQDAIETRGGLAEAAEEVAVVLRLGTQKVSLLHSLAGEPRRVISGTSPDFESILIEARAMAAINNTEMFDSTAVSKVLGAKSSNSRDAASTRRARSELIGIPSRGRYLYPAFQFDRRAQRVFPVVAAINRHLDASEDPWGVASWWLAPHPRLNGASPQSLVGSDREGDLPVLAGLTASDEELPG